MSKTVDARGLACPQPVILTRNAMQEVDRVLTLVDNESALTNVSRMAQKAGWQVDVAREGDEYHLSLSQGQVPAPDSVPAVGRAEAIAGPRVLVVSADVMGRGQAELGNVLIRAFFHTLGEVEPRPQTLILFNTGVRLACQGSPVIDDLHALEADGLEILVCGTCLSYFEITDQLAVGQVSNMYDIAETMLRAGHIVNL